MAEWDPYNFSDGVDDGEDGGLLSNPDGNDCSQVLARLTETAISGAMFERKQAARSVLEAFRQTYYADEDVGGVISVIEKLADDVEQSVRSEMVDQMPQIAQFCHEESGRLGYVISEHILPHIVRLLTDKFTQVRQTSQSSLLILMVRGIIESSQVADTVLPLILEPRAPDEYRTEIAAFMSKLAPLVGKEVTIKSYLLRFCKLCDDPLFQVRRCCASHMGDLATVIGTRLTEIVILPKFLKLCKDDVWGVRKGCAEVFTLISTVSQLSTRKKTLAPAFIALLQDPSRWVRISAYQTLGSFITTFAADDSSTQESESSEVEQAFLERFSSLQTQEAVVSETTNAEELTGAVENVDDNLEKLLPFAATTNSSVPFATIEPKFSNNETNEKLDVESHVSSNEDKESILVGDSKSSFTNEKSNKEEEGNNCAPSILSPTSPNEITDIAPVSELSSSTNSTTSCNNSDDNVQALEDMSSKVEVLGPKRGKLQSESPEADCLSTEIKDRTEENENRENNKDSNGIIEKSKENTAGEETEVIEGNTEACRATLLESDVHEPIVAENSGSSSNSSSSTSDIEPIKSMPEEDDKILTRDIQASSIEGFSTASETVINPPIQAEQIEEYADKISADISIKINVIEDQVDEEDESKQNDNNLNENGGDSANDQEEPMDTDEEPNFDDQYDDKQEDQGTDTAPDLSPHINPNGTSISGNSITDLHRTYLNLYNASRDQNYADESRADSRARMMDPYDDDDWDPENTFPFSFGDDLSSVWGGKEKARLLEDIGVEPCTPNQQDVVPSELVEHFTSMCEPMKNKAIDNALTGFCVYSLPAVVLTLGQENWPILRECYEQLATSMQWKIRYTLASGLHEIARIVGRTIAERDLVPFFNALVKDVDEVRVGLLRNLANFIKILGTIERRKCLDSLRSFLETDNKQNWRFRLELTRQLEQLTEIYEAEEVYKYLRPIAIDLVKDSVAEVRKTALYVITHLILRVTSCPLGSGEPNLVRDFLLELVETLGHSNKWSLRQNFASLAGHLIGIGALNPNQFAQDILPHLINLSMDPVPNVRLIVAKTLLQCVSKLEYFADTSNPHNEILTSTIVKLQLDTDNDVRSFAHISQVSSTHNQDGEVEVEVET